MPMSQRISLSLQAIQLLFTFLNSKNKFKPHEKVQLCTCDYEGAGVLCSGSILGQAQDPQLPVDPQPGSGWTQSDQRQLGAAAGATTPGSRKKDGTFSKTLKYQFTSAADISTNVERDLQVENLREKHPLIGLEWIKLNVPDCKDNKRLKPFLLRAG